MKLEKRSAAAASTAPSRKGSAGVSGTVSPSRAARAAAKSAWSKRNPPTMTTDPRMNIRNIRGTRVRSYTFAPRRLTRTKTHRKARASPTLTPPESRAAAVETHSREMAMSRRKGMMR